VGLGDNLNQGHVVVWRLGMLTVSSRCSFHVVFNQPCHVLYTVTPGLAVFRKREKESSEKDKKIYQFYHHFPVFTHAMLC